MTQLLCIVAAFALGQALFVPQPGAFGFLAFAVVAVLLAAGRPRAETKAELRAILLRDVLNACLALQCVDLVVSAPLMYPQPGTHLGIFHAGVLLASFLIAFGQLAPERLGRYAFPVLLGVFAFLGRWTIQSSPNPFIDVDIFQRDALTYLLKGVDPYSLRPPDIYGGQFNAPELVENGHLTYGYPYPPLTLLLALPGHVLLGDYRYSQLAAMLGAAALIGYAKPGRIGFGVAALLLFGPRTFFVLEQGWTEPFVLLLFAALMALALRARARDAQLFSPLLIGLLLVVKQYVPLVTWPLLASTEGGLRRKALLIAGAVTVPFIAWDPKDFWVSVVRSHVLQPFRADALSFPSMAAWPWAAWLGWGFGVGAFLWVLWRNSVSLSTYALACAAGLLLFFAFGRQAGANYYWLVVGLLALTASLHDAEREA